MATGRLGNTPLRLLRLPPPPPPFVTIIGTGTATATPTATATSVSAAGRAARWTKGQPAAAAATPGAHPVRRPGGCAHTAAQWTRIATVAHSGALAVLLDAGDKGTPLCAGTDRDISAVTWVSRRALVCWDSPSVPRADLLGHVFTRRRAPRSWTVSKYHITSARARADGWTNCTFAIDAVQRGDEYKRGAGAAHGLATKRGRLPVLRRACGMRALAARTGVGGATEVEVFCLTRRHGRCHPPPSRAVPPRPASPQGCCRPRVGLHCCATLGLADSGKGFAHWLAGASS